MIPCDRLLAVQAEAEGRKVVEPDPTIAFVACIRPRELKTKPPDDVGLVGCARCNCALFVTLETRELAPNAKLVCVRCSLKIDEAN